MGPTAVGKTALAVSLVAQMPLDIISVDSAMVYRGLNIGTGKPDAKTLAAAPHRLIDIRDPDQPYSAAEFCADARLAIDEIHAAGRIPLLVGGTGLYFRALRDGLSTLPAADQEVRARISEEAGRVGWHALHARLAAVDPESAANIHQNDPQRIQRALEVYELSGEPMSQLQSAGRERPLHHRIHSFVLEPADRSQLHADIQRRFEQMLAQGLVEEVAALCDRHRLTRDLPSMRAVGYRQVLDYLHGDIDRRQRVARGIAATRQLARRQLTWLRGLADANRFGGTRREVETALRSQVGSLVNSMS